MISLDLHTDFISFCMRLRPARLKQKFHVKLHSAHTRESQLELAHLLTLSLISIWQEMRYVTAGAVSCYRDTPYATKPTHRWANHTPIVTSMRQSQVNWSSVKSALSFVAVYGTCTLLYKGTICQTAETPWQRASMETLDNIALMWTARVIACFAMFLFCFQIFVYVQYISGDVSSNIKLFLSYLFNILLLLVYFKLSLLKYELV